MVEDLVNQGHVVECRITRRGRRWQKTDHLGLRHMQEGEGLCLHINTVLKKEAEEESVATSVDAVDEKEVDTASGSETASEPGP